MKIHRLRNLDEYNEHLRRDQVNIAKHTKQIFEWEKDQTGAFTVQGFSYTAQQYVDFHVDFQHATTGGRVNWRERVNCPITHFNNRMRATIHVFDIEMECYSDSTLYITEQITPMYDYFKKNFLHVAGSEYLGRDFAPGQIDEKGRRHEDLTNLSFADQEFDAIVSLDVIEHIPSYKLAFEESFRVLKTGGRLLWTVPFIPTSAGNITRAEIVDGEIVHHLPPEYHGDPLSDAGCLCFTHFGWEMFEQVREAGFRDAYAIPVQSLEFGYLGSMQFQFIAIK